MGREKAMAASKSLEGLMRTHHCGELRDSDVGSEVILCGWVNKYRNLGALHFVDVRDIAEGTIKALEKAESGKKYILSGNHLKIKDLAQTIGETGNVRVPKRVLPSWFLYMMLPFFSLQSRLQGKPPLLTRDSLDILLNGNPNISSQKVSRRTHLFYPFPCGV